MSNVADLTAASIDAALSAPAVVLIEFTAAWCASCQPMIAILEEIAVERSGSANVARVDVALHPSVADRFGVQSLPTSIVFVDAQPIRRLTGACTKRRLLRVLDSVEPPWEFS